MLEQAFDEVYTKFRTHFFKQIFSAEQKTELSAAEEMTAEIICAMGTPTVSEFAKFANISLPNATYRLNALVRKGYIKKVKEQKDRREYRLHLTQKFYDYANIGARYTQQVLQELRKRLTPEQLGQLIQTLKILSDDIMSKE